MQRSGPLTKDTSTVALGLAQVRIGNAAANISTYTACLTANDSIGALANTKFESKVDKFKLESGFPLLEDMSIPIREACHLACAFKELSSRNLALSRGLDPSADMNSAQTFIDSTTVAGTTTGTITTNNLGGVVDTEYTVVFGTATSGKIYSKSEGLVHTFANLTSAMSPQYNSQNRFTIPANFFSGTWAADETYVFKTTPFIAGTAAYNDNHAGEIKLGAIKAPDYVRMEAVYTYPNQVNHMYIIFPRANITSNCDIDFKEATEAAPPITIESKRADSGISGGHVTWDDAPLGRIYMD